MNATDDCKEALAAEIIGMIDKERLETIIDDLSQKAYRQSEIAMDAIHEYGDLKMMIGWCRYRLMQLELGDNVRMP